MAFQFKGLGELKVKESNRLKVMYETLKNIRVKENCENQIQIEAKFTCSKNKTFDDHRIMSSLILELLQWLVEIDDMSMIATSFPNFKKLLRIRCKIKFV